MGKQLGFQLCLYDDFYRYEQAYLTSLVGLRSEKYFWLGLSDVQDQGIFSWANGEAVSFTHWDAGMPGRCCDEGWWVLSEVVVPV